VARYKVGVDSTNLRRAIGDAPVEFTYQSMIAQGVSFTLASYHGDSRKTQNGCDCR
jgi:hypothetical protein